MNKQVRGFCKISDANIALFRANFLGNDFSQDNKLKLVGYVSAPMMESTVLSEQVIANLMIKTHQQLTCIIFITWFH